MTKEKIQEQEALADQWQKEYDGGVAGLKTPLLSEYIAERMKRSAKRTKSGEQKTTVVDTNSDRKAA